MKKIALRERIRTMWNTLTDNPSAGIKLVFDELPPLLIVALEADAEADNMTFAEAAYHALVDGARLHAAQRIEVQNAEWAKTHS